jgi:hypothetical protein
LALPRTRTGSCPRPRSASSNAASVFKKRKAAKAIKALLGKGVRIVECRKLKSGKLKRVTPVRGRKKKRE